MTKQIFGLTWEVRETEVPVHVQEELLVHYLKDGYYLAMFKLTNYFGDVGGDAYEISLCREMNIVRRIAAGAGTVTTKSTKKELIRKIIWEREHIARKKTYKGGKEKIVKTVTNVPEYVARIYERDQDGFDAVLEKCKEIIDNGREEE